MRLLLALHNYDMSRGQGREVAKQEVLDVCNSFSQMRRSLEEVYSKTRFMEQPKGYIEDMNHHHHLSALSLNSDWIYLYEMPYTKMVVEKLKAKNR